MGGWDRTRWSHVMLALAVGGLAGWIGYRNEVAAVTAAGRLPLTFRSAARHILTPKAERDAMKRLEALRQRAGRGELTPSETAACWQVIRGFSEEQVKAYLADLPPGRWRSANETLTLMLFHRWAQLAPETAAREAMKEPYSKNANLTAAILGAWIPRDQEGAIRWVDESGSEYFKIEIRNIMGPLLVRQDPATGLEKAQALGPRALAAALRTMAAEMGATAESRQEFFALEAKYGKMKEWNGALSTLARVAAERDPESLLAMVKINGPPTERALVLQNTAMWTLMQRHPEEVMNLTMDPASGVNQWKQLSNFNSWVENHPKEATAWAVANGRQEFIADSVKKGAMAMLQSGWQYGTREEWADKVAERYETWKGIEPAAAETWLKTMPSDVRKSLGGRRPDAAK